MPVVVVANPKGGVGKSTMATNMAGFFASKGHAVMLGDADRQQSSRLWLGLRPNGARPISTWQLSEGNIVKPPKGTTHVVLDTPAGMHGKVFKDVLQLADKVIVPLQPSIFDIFATRAFLDELAEHRKASSCRSGSSACGSIRARSRPTNCTSSWTRWACRCWAICATPRTTFTSPRGG